MQLNIPTEKRTMQWGEKFANHIQLTDFQRKILI